MDLLTVREAAAMLRVSEVTLRRYVASGKLPAVRVGRNVRIERAAAEGLAMPTATFHDDEIEDELTHVVPKRGFSPGSSLWDLAGFIKDDGPTDMAENHDRYLAEAYADLHEEAYDPEEPHRRIRMTSREALLSEVERLNDEEIARVRGYVDEITRSRGQLNGVSSDALDSSGDDDEYDDELTHATPKAGFAPGSRLSRLAGFIKTDGPTDMSTNKHKYLAEAYGDLHDE